MTVKLKDDGGTANGGVDTSAAQTFTITVTAVNDSPSFTKGADQSVDEDAGPQIVDGWATSISPGPPNESDQTVHFLVSTDNDGLFAVLPAIDSSGTLTYAPATNANGAASVTVRLQDDAGGADTSDPQIFTITVGADNDAPVLDNSGDPVLTPIPRNSGDPDGDTVASFVGTSISDIDAGALQGIAVVNASGPGVWQFSIDAGQTWTPLGSIDVAAARLLRKRLDPLRAR